MRTIIFVCFALGAITTRVHYEGLRTLNAGLSQVKIPRKSKIWAAIFATFVTHTMGNGAVWLLDFWTDSVRQLGQLVRVGWFHIGQLLVLFSRKIFHSRLW